MRRDEIASFLERYARARALPVRTAIEVTGARTIDDGFELDTSDGAVRTRVLAAASGAFQTPHRPAGLAGLPGDIPVLDLTAYTNPSALPDGDVLVIGSGQSGCQIAEELHRARRDVVLACGRAPWAPRRIGDRDLVWWLLHTGFLDQPYEQAPPGIRLVSNPLATGHGGGHDLHYRTLQAMGVTLAGRFAGVDDGAVRFDEDLAACVAFGDARYEEILGLARNLVTERGLPVIDVRPPPPFIEEAPTSLPASRFAAVIVTSGFRPRYGAWLPWPEAFDQLGFPVQVDGASTVIDGLHFMGVHFLRKRKSAILLGAREDAEVVADGIAARLGAEPAS